jgi:flagellar basal-body rod modification protein FlgD
MTTTTALAGTSTTATSGTTGVSSKDENPQDRFLKLLVNQLKNQDPLNPLENAEVTTQLAQISTVSGIDQLNLTMNTMSEKLVGAQSLQASSMLGRHVVAAGDAVEHDASGVTPLSFSLDVPSSLVRIEVTDAKNRVVFSQEVPQVPAGMSSFEWDGSRSVGGDGKVAAGVYRFSVAAMDANGKMNAVKDTYGYARVESVSLADGVKINTGALGQVSFDDVEQVI